jgi:membrane protease YdiL (CAAX protease family)
MQTQIYSPFSAENHLLQLARQGKPRLSPALDRWLYPWLALVYALILPLLVGVLVAIPMLRLLRSSGSSLESLVSGGSTLPAGPANLYLTVNLLLSFAPLYLLIWGWIVVFERRQLWTVGFERPGAPGKYLRGFLLGGVLISLAIALAALSGVAPGAPLAAANDPTGGLLALAGVALILLGWLVQGGAEEVLTRGFLLPIFGVRYGIPIAILVSSVLFSSLHLFNNYLSGIALLNLALFGVFASLYALREGSLWGICALHASWNWVQGNLFGLPVSGTNSGASLLSLQLTGPDWWVGGAFGPEGGLAVTLVLLIGCVVLLLPRRM